MGAMRGMLLGGLGLAVLHAVVTHPEQAARLPGWVETSARAFLDPGVPALPTGGPRTNASSVAAGRKAADDAAASGSFADQVIGPAPQSVRDFWATQPASP